MRLHAARLPMLISILVQDTRVLRGTVSSDVAFAVETSAGTVPLGIYGVVLI